MLIVFTGLTFFEPRLFLHLFTASLPSLLNFIVFLLWLPLLVCLAGARFKDFYQLVAIILQLVFLLSPILFLKKDLGQFQWLAKLNPLHQSIGHLRDSILYCQAEFSNFLTFLVINVIGLYVSLALLRRESQILPFLF